MKTRKTLCASFCLCAQLLPAVPGHAAGTGSVHWEESGKQIRLETVCASHKYGSIRSRKCRAKASNYFIRQCKSYTQKHSTASGSKRKKYQSGKRKYCDAARHFKIVD